MNSKSWTDLEPLSDSGLLSDVDFYLLDETYKPYARGETSQLDTQPRRRKLLLDAALASVILIIGLIVDMTVTVGRFQIEAINFMTGIISGLVISIFAVFFLVISVRRLIFLGRLERGQLVAGEVVKVRQHKLLNRIPTGLLPKSRLVVTYAFTPPEANTRIQSEQLALLNIAPETTLKHLRPGRQIAVQYVDDSFHAIL